MIRRQLSLDAVVDQIVVIQEAIRGLLKQELAPIRRLSYIGAFEITAAHMWSRAIAGLTLSGRRMADREKIYAEIEDTDAAARVEAVKRVREPNPEHEGTPPEPLPEADEAFSLDPVDAKLFQEGGE